MSLLDFLFARSAGIYTSLLFEYGSQQPIHRDSPFFHTFPINYFFGVWFALEDIHPDSGPLIYVPGGYRFQVKHRMIFEQLERQNPQQSTKELLDRDWNATTARSSQRRRKSRLHVQWCSRRETVQFGIRSAPWRYEGQQSDADTKEHSLSLCSHRRASFISKVFFSPPTSNRPPLWLSRISRAPLCGGRPPLLPGRTRGIKFNHMDEMFGKPAAPAGKQFSWQGKAVS
jgi:hypothetical protein